MDLCLSSIVSGTWQVSINIWRVNEPAAKSTLQLSSGSSTRSMATSGSRWSYFSLSHPHFQLLRTLARASMGHSSNLPACSVGPGPAAAALKGNMLEMHILGPRPRTTESEALGMGLGYFFYNKSSGWPHAHEILSFVYFEKLPAWESLRSAP